MPLFLLKRKGDRHDVDWEEDYAILVRARNEPKARELASKYTKSASQTTKELWLNPKKTTCEILHSAGPEEVIIADNRGS